MKTNYLFKRLGFFLSFLIFAMLFFVSQNATAQYCTAGPSSTADSNVDSVYIAGDASSAIAFKGCPGVAGVQDLTATTNVNVTVGSSYTLKVQFGTCGGNYGGQGRAWIDWNKNNIFETGETIGFSGGTPGSWAMSTWNFTVPLAGMTNGPTTMRVMQWEGGAQPLNPCGTFTWGSVTDFTVTVGGVYIPQTDLGVVAWNSPTSSCGMSTTESINIDVKNTGTVTQSAYTLKYSIDNGTTWVSQAMTTPIMPDSVLNHTFATPANFSAVGTYNCLAVVVLANDSASYNDTLAETVAAAAGMAVPHFNNLESLSNGNMTTGDWISSTTSNPRWDIRNGTTTSSSTGPNVDHTLGTSTGKYAYLETSGGSLGSTSYLTSRCMNFSNQPAVLNFWYHMYGAAMGTLEVEQKVGGVWISTGWSKTGQQQASGAAPWAEATVAINPAADGIRFKGVRGSSYTSDMAIDDINIYIPMPNDLAMLDWISPLSGTTPSATMPISIDVFNAGLAAQDSIPVKYSIDGGTTWVSEVSLPSLTPGDTLHYTFTATANMATPGYYDCIAVVSNPGDGDASNDTLSLRPYLCTSLSGSYLLGSSTSADFATFDDAVFALSNCGVSGPVVINVESGTYTEQVTIGAISGASATNTVTFKSLTGNNADVTLQYASTGSGTNWTLKLQGADYVTIKNMTIKATGGSYGRVIEIKGAANYNTIDSCKIMMSTTTTSSNYAGIYDYNTKNEYNTYSNNEISGGYYGMYLYGPGTTNLEKGNVVTGNTITDYWYYAGYIYYQDSIQFTNNNIENRNGSTTAYGPRFYYCDASTITDNKINIHGTGTLYGMYMYYCDSTATSRTLVANNFITTSQGSGTHYGIYNRYNKGCDVYYNSINNASGGSSSSYPLYFYQNSTSYGGNNVVNNIFANNGNGYAAYVYNNTYQNADYNIYYRSTTGNLCYWGGNRADLAALKTAYPNNNVSSLSLSPGFFSATDLHLNDVAVDGTGTPISVTTDIDGEVRNATTPDIGADEFMLISHDAGVTALAGPVGPCPGVASNVEATIKNFGILNLASATVNWSINGVTQTPFSYTGTAAPGADTTLTIGSYTFAANTPYSIVVWTSMPNGVADQKPSNDTLFVNGMQTAMPAGTYTIGPDSLDTWPTFTAAVGAMVANGVCGAVVINVDSGVYNEQVEIPEILGASAVNTITFKSASGVNTDVVLTYASSSSSDYYTVYLNGADYISFEDMTIAATGSYGRTIYLRNGADYNEFSGNLIQTVVSSSGNYYCVYNYSGNDEFNTFSNNVFTGGYYSMYMYGQSSSSWEEGTVIEDNIIEDFYYYGIYSYYQDGIKINNNVIEGGHVASYGRAIYANYSMNAYEYIGNEIHVSSTGTGSSYGIRDYYSNYYSYNSNPTGYGLVANNMISISSGTGSNYGIYAYYSQGTEYAYNSVYLASGGTSSRALYQYSTTSNPMGQTFLNNMFINEGNGYAAYFGTTAKVDSSDYNNFISGATNFIYWSGNKTTLAAFQTASGTDASSISQNPMFMSATDLHLTINSPQNGGTPIAGITEDIDGDTRSLTTPDMGADEWDPAAHDLFISEILTPVSSICGSTTDSVRVVLNNWGQNTEMNVPVVVSVVTPSGTVSVNTVVSSIAVAYVDTVYVGVVNTTTPGTYDYTAYATLASDSVPANDTAYKTTMTNQIFPVPHMEDFATAPYNWDATSNVNIGSGHGLTSDAMYVNMYSGVTYETANMTNKIGPIPANAALSFDYRITDYTGGAATVLELDTINIWATSDCGTSWSLLYTIDTNSHVPATTMETVIIPMTAFTGNNVLLAVEFKYNDPSNSLDYYVDMDNIAITVTPSVDLGADTSFCPGTSITLDAGAAPAGYTYSYMWNALTGDTLGMSQSLVVDSAMTIIATVKNQAGLYDMDTVVASLHAATPLSFTGLAATYCDNDMASTLMPTPVGGVFSGNGITGSMFDPATSGLGNQVITYSFTDSLGCYNMTSNMTDVYEAADVDLMDTTICEGESVMLSAGAPAPAAPGLIFSMYIEGSSNNKAIEVYNATMDTLNLDNYSIATNYNGNPWSGQYRFPAGYMLAPGDVFVIGNTAADSAILSVTDDTLAYNEGGYVVGFNGDDVRALYMHNSAIDSVMIDIIGRYDLVDPGSGWDVAGVTNATQNHSLVRKPTIVGGNTDWDMIAGIDSVSSEYIVYPQNTYMQLGAHSAMAPPAMTYTYLWSNGDTTASITVMPTMTTTYTVTVDNGNCLTVDSAVVTVNPLPMVNLGPDTSFKWTWESITLDAGNPNASWDWSTGDITQTVMLDNSNTIKGANTISVEVTENGCVASDTIIVTVIDDVSINGALSDLNIEVYPNPAKGQFNMTIDGYLGNVKMDIVDVAGQIVHTEKLNVTANFVGQFNVHTLASGVYYIKLTANNSVKVQRLIIQK